jgi:glycosyltransferase involved in cell wall biosynthesis
LKIAVNTRLLLKNKLEGIGSFEYENLLRLTTQHPEHQFFFLFDRKYHPDFIFGSNVTPVILPPQARHPILYHIWFQYSIGYYLKKLKPDLFFSPDGYLPLRTKTKCLTVFHDLNWEHFPEDLPGYETRFYKRYFPKFAAKATRICTVSEFSKQDIMERYGIEAEKIDVVYSGLNTRRKAVNTKEKERAKNTFAGGKPYFIFVGSLHPRKNLHNLFRAYDLFRKKQPQAMRLLVVGQKKWWTEKLKNAYEAMQFKEEVIFTGRVSDDDLNALVGGATAMAYVSNFEGFGLPIVEAFHAEVPLITSTISSMPEIAGEAALFADPADPESIALQLEKIFIHPELRAALIEKGKQQLTRFSWQKTSDLLWNSIEKTIKQKK